MKNKQAGFKYFILIPKYVSNGNIHHERDLLSFDKDVILIDNLSTPHNTISWYQLLNGIPEIHLDTIRAIIVVTIIQRSAIYLYSGNAKFP